MKDLNMNKNFKTIYFIGNGFDLHHSLKTQYIDLKNFIKLTNEDLALKIDKLLLYCGCTDEEIKDWKDLENYFCNINEMDYDSILDNALQNCETNIEKASYWGDAQYNADKIRTDLIETLMELKKSFAGWIESINLNKVKKSKLFTLNKSGLYISFNYTETLEKVYTVEEENIIHIHGKVNEYYVLGHNDIRKAPYTNPHETQCDGITRFPDEDFRCVEVRKILNKTYNEIYDAYYKNSIKIIDKYKDAFKSISNAYKLVFMGLSMGTQDLIYLEEISKHINKKCSIEIYYYSSNDLDRFVSITKKYFSNQQIEYIKW